MPGRTGLSPCRKEWERRTLPRLELQDTQPCFAFRSFFIKHHLKLWWRPLSDQTRKISHSPCNFSGSCIASGKTKNICSFVNVGHGEGRGESWQRSRPGFWSHRGSWRGRHHHSLNGDPLSHCNWDQPINFANCSWVIMWWLWEDWMKRRTST